MDGVKFLLDTNVVLGIVKQRREAVACLEMGGANPQQYAYSSITRMEALGFPAITAEEETAIDGLLGCLTHLAISSEVETTTIRLRRRHKIKLPDAIIVATAVVYDLKLLTLDQDLARVAAMEQMKCSPST